MSMWTNERQEKFRAGVRAFAESEIAPFAPKMDEEQHYPEHLVAKINDLGLLGMTVDSRYGGTFTATLTYIIAVEEVSRVCGSSGSILAAHNSLGCSPIYEFGSEDQKRKYLPE